MLLHDNTMYIFYSLRWIILKWNDRSRLSTVLTSSCNFDVLETPIIDKVAKKRSADTFDDDVLNVGVGWVFKTLYM